MALGTYAPDPFFTGFDANGNPLSGGKLYTYLAGTTTLQATYTDVALSVANANPIILDSAGRATIFLTPGASYKFVLQDSTGAAIATRDNVSAVPATSINLDVTGTAGEALTAGQPVYLSDGSGSKVAGQWYKADATNTYSSTTGPVGMVPASIASAASGTIRLAGSVTGLSALVVGTAYYVSGTPGSVTSTAPANRRLLGTADTTSSLVLGSNPPPFTGLASGTASNTTFLRGDQTWATAWTVVTTTSTGAQNDFAPGLIGNTHLRCNNASLLTISGFASGYAGQRLVISSVGAGQVDCTHQTLSTAANQLFNCATSGNTSLAAGSGTAEYVYDATTLRWRLVAHEQGAWITPTYAGGSYTGNANTWTVQSGDVTTQAYVLRGRTLTVAWNLVTTSITGGVITTLQIGNAAWGSFTAAKEIYGFLVYGDAGANDAIGRANVAAAGTLILLSRGSGVGTFALSADLTSARGALQFEVQ